LTLTIVDRDQAEDGRSVGTCDGGTKKNVYKGWLSCGDHKQDGTKKSRFRVFFCRASNGASRPFQRRK